MDPVQLMMAAHQASATVAAQTPDRALQAAIVQSRPNLWVPLSTNPAAYPNLLGWLASTGNVEVLINLRTRGYLTNDAAVNAAGGVGDTGTAAVADSAVSEPTVDPAFSQEDPAQTEPTESVKSIGDGDAPADGDEAIDEPGPIDGDEVEDIASADSGESGDNQDAEEPAESPDVVEDAQVTESAAEVTTEPDTDTATGEAQEPCPDDSGNGVEDGAEDASSSEAGVEPETEESAEYFESTEEAEAEGPTPEDPLAEDTVADGRSAEPAEAAEEPGADESDKDSEDVKGDEAEGPAPEDPHVEDSGAAEDAADGDFGEAGVEPETEESAEDSEDTEGTESATEPDAEPEAADEVATDADEARESGADQPGDEASEEQAAEETTVDESADERDAEPVDAVEESGTDEPAESSGAAEAVTKPDAETATDEAADSDNNDTTVLAAASQRHEVDSTDTTDVTASAQSAAVTSGQTAGSAAPVTGSAESVALPVPPPPSAEDIAAWAETPSGVPSGFSAAQPAVELDMFGPQMVAQIPPPQQKRPSKSSSGRLVAIIVVLLLVIVGGGGLQAGSHFVNKDKSEDTPQNKADSDGGEDGKQNGQVDAAAMSAAVALSSGAVKACSSMSAFTIASVEDGQGELKAHGNMATSCAEGDLLAGSSSQVLVYSSTSPTGGVDVDHLVASGTFDPANGPLIIPNGSRAVTLHFGEQHYLRIAKDLDLKDLTVRPSFGRGSSSTATAKNSANSAMTIASSASSNANQETQDEQAVGDTIQWQIKHDYPIVMNSLRDKRTPQLSSKQAGLVADGQTWTKRTILAEYLKTQQANPKAVIIDTSQWPVYDTGGWWMTLQGDIYSDGDRANVWCDVQGYDPDYCLARRIESNETSQGTTKLR